MKYVSISISYSPLFYECRIIKKKKAHTHSHQHINDYQDCSFKKNEGTREEKRERMKNDLWFLSKSDIQLKYIEKSLRKRIKRSLASLFVCCCYCKLV